MLRFVVSGFTAILLGLMAAVSARADTVTLFIQPIAEDLRLVPKPTGPFTYGLNLCGIPLSQCLNSPLASLSFLGPHTFTAMDAGFTQIVSVIQSPAPPPINQILIPFVSWTNNGQTFLLENAYGGALIKPDKHIEQIVIDAPPVADIIQSGANIWVAVDANGTQIRVKYSVVGPDLLPETDSLILSCIALMFIVGMKSRFRA